MRDVGGAEGTGRQRVLEREAGGRGAMRLEEGVELFNVAHSEAGPAMGQLGEVLVHDRAELQEMLAFQVPFAPLA